MSAVDRFAIYRDSANRWRWQANASNGKTLADSGQSYSRQIDCVRGMEMVVGDVVVWDFKAMATDRSGYYRQGRLTAGRTLVEATP